jgi:thrombospondin motif-containing protein 9
MPHDDDYKCQSFLDSQNNPGSANHMHQQFTSDSPNSVTGGQQHYVMSRMLDHNTYPWAWSRCSRHFLTEFLE